MSLTEDQLESLIARCAASDRDALSQLYKASSAKLYGLGLRILQNSALVEEAMQEVYVKIWEKADTYQRALGQPSVWLNIVMRRQCLDVLRRQKVRVHSSMESIDPDTLVSDQDGPYLWAVKNESRSTLSICLARLDRTQQDVISMLYIRGHTQEEIAKHLDIPLGTVKSWSRRCMQKLRECMHSLTGRDVRLSS